MTELYTSTNKLLKNFDDYHKLDEVSFASKIAQELMPLSTDMARLCNKIEDLVPDESWPFPKYFDMLFIR
jgi:glutamine synthetase type III